MEPSCPEISVVICTRNRCRLLQKTLESICQQTLSKEIFEVVVVDNNSEDDTAEILKQFESLPLRYCCEKEIGISFARNRGIQEAKGKYLAFLDDDAEADADWLEAIYQTFLQVDPAPDCIGGRVFLRFEEQEPHWMSESLYPFLAKVDYGETPSWLSKEQAAYTVNMAFLLSSLKDVKGFDSNLGYKHTHNQPQNLFSAEDLWLQRQMHAQGKKIYYQPRALVFHFVSKSRLQKKWFRQKLYDSGRESCYLERLQGKKRWQIFLRGSIRFGWTIFSFPMFIFSPPKQRFWQSLLIRFHWGRVVASIVSRLP